MEPNSHGKLAAMLDSLVNDVLALPAEERLELLDRIWDSLTAEADALPLSEAHARAIDEALEDHIKNPDDVMTRSELFTALRRE